MVPLCLARNPPTQFQTMATGGWAETPCMLRGLMYVSLGWLATWMLLQHTRFGSRQFKERAGSPNPFLRSPHPPGWGAKVCVALALPLSSKLGAGRMGCRTSQRQPKACCGSALGGMGPGPLPYSQPGNTSQTQGPECSPASGAQAVMDAGAPWAELHARLAAVIW